MRARPVGLSAAAMLSVTLLAAPTAAQAVGVPECIAVPGKVGAAIDANIANYPVEKPDAYRTINGKREPVYRVEVGEVLHIPTRITNTGTCRYWTYGGDFTARGHDAFTTPGNSTWVDGKGNKTWSSAIGVPTWDPDPDRNHPYTRRSERLWEQIYPGDTSKRLWGLTVDNLARPGTYYSVSFQWDANVSDPPVNDTAVSAQIWLIRD